MEIKIRDLAPSTVKSLDEKAKRNGMSRQQYLKNVIEKVANVDSFYDERNEYVSLVKIMETIVGHNTEVLQDYRESMERIEYIMTEIERRLEKNEKND